MSNKTIQSVPTNIITGFLGTGKTSAILHLLKNKPSQERWAVLVNEFGEIGVDGALLTAGNTSKQGLFIREVPGGCMCCAAGLPMQVALKQLLQKAKPDRLLIEPTGLGHPKEILQVLSSKYYQAVLNLQKTLTLVDARNLQDTRYTEHEIFNQQIAIADTVVANKVDLYQESDKKRLTAYLKAHGQAAVGVIFTEHGNLELSQLVGSSAPHSNSHQHHHHHQPHNTGKVLVAEMPLPASGFIKAANKGEGFNSVGWRFSAKIVFNYNKLFTLLNNLKVDRVKGIFITDKGILAFNKTAESLTEKVCDFCEESRIEMIGQQLDDNFEAALISCYE